MHTDGDQTSIKAVNPYAAAAEKATAAQRASRARKKRLKKAGGTEGVPVAAEGFTVGHWSDRRPIQAQSGVEYQISTAGGDGGQGF